MARISVEERPPVIERERTIVEREDRGSGFGGVLAAVLALLVVAVIAWFLFTGGLASFAGVGDAGRDTNSNINPPAQQAPNVNINVPQPVQNAPQPAQVAPQPAQPKP